MSLMKKMPPIMNAMLAIRAVVRNPDILTKRPGDTLEGNEFAAQAEPRTPLGSESTGGLAALRHLEGNDAVHHTCTGAPEDGEDEGPEARH